MRLLFSVVLLLLLAANVSAQPQMPATTHGRGITVTGSATVTGEPDKAKVQLTAQKSSPVMAKARAETVAVVEKFLVLTKRLGIDPGKVRTTGAMVSPEYRWDKDTGQQILTGYVVQRQLEVEVTDLDKLGALIEGAVSAGVNNVAPPVLDSSKRHELNRQALAAAARDAEANARAVADTLGMRLGALRTLTVADAAALPPPIPVLRTMAAAPMESAEATYAAGSLEFEARVTATFDAVAP